MKIFIAACIAVLTAASCGNNKKEASEKALNEQSAQCIRIMNGAEEQKNTALAAGDNETAAAMQKTIDSAATENAKIGQQLSDLK